MRSRWPRILLAVAVGVSCASRATAQTPAAPADTAVYQMGGVLVRGARPIATPGGSGAVTAKLDSLSLGAVPTVEQVLRALPGTHIRTNSRGEAEVTARGSESRQVALLLDGIPLTFAWDGRADVSVIPALAVEDVTLVRGLSSLTQGPNTLGGVVELSTHPSAIQRQRPTAQIRGGVDELGGYGAAGSVSVPADLGWGVFTARAGIGRRDTPGVSLPRGVEEPLPTEPGQRRNTDLEETNGFMALRVDSDKGAYASLLGAGYKGERGIAAQLGVTAARFWRYPHLSRGIGVLSAGTGKRGMPWGGTADLQVSGGYDRGATEIDAYDSRAYQTITSEEDGKDEVLSVRTTASQTVGDRADLRLAFSYGDIRHDEILNGVLNAYRQRLRSEAAQMSVRVPGVGPVRGFDLSAGATHDASNTPETGTPPTVKPSHGPQGQWGGRFGVSAHLGQESTTAHASISRRPRFPSLRELYSGSLGSFDPNPDLRPEHLVAIEAGVTSRTPRTGLQIVGFHHRLTDAVVRIRPPGENFQRVNQEGVRSAGVEVLASRAIGVVEVSTDLIAQDVKVLDPAAGLTRPENMPELMGGLRVQIPVVAGLFVAAEGRYTGEQFVLDPENGGESRLAPAGQLNMEVSRNWSLGGGAGWFRGLQLRGAFDNLTDTAQYDAFGLPQPGRMMRMELRVY